jgi:hypothetical protein
MDSSLFINLIGWAGSAAILLAYGLVSTKRVQGDSAPYQVLNLVGSVCLLSNTVYWGAYPSSFVNLVWTGIALFALAGIVRRKTA